MSERLEPGYSESVLGDRLVVRVYEGRRGSDQHYQGPLISLGSLGNRAGSMNLTPLELAALLDGPLERALEEANRRS